MPLSAFIIRPFGEEKVFPPANSDQRRTRLHRAGKPHSFDFDYVHKTLIGPALEQLGIEANTTEAVIQAGNIREDMFHRLMTADLVVADVSYPNPNVYYELGIRHAFRDRYTFMVRCKGFEDPFDLKTDRYFCYDYEHLEDSIEPLSRAILTTITSERVDSPVFRLLPGMRLEDRAHFVMVPQDFAEAVERARKHRRPGDLRLLAVECEGSLWEVEGLRMIGRAQYELNFMHGAQITWEQIVRRYPADVEANMHLSTVYLRISDDTRADEALARVANLNVHDVNTASEIQSLVARNYKAKWTDSWYKPLQDLKAAENKYTAADFNREAAQIRKRALSNPLLRKARQEYLLAYEANLNYIYAGLNALTLMLIEWSLAREFTDTWRSLVDIEEQATTRLKELEHDIDKLTTALTFAIGVEKKRLATKNQVDFWFEIEEAAFLCLTSKNTDRVKQNYNEALVWAPGSAKQSMRPALLHYLDLKVRHPNEKVDIAKNVNAALDLIEDESQADKQGDILLFVGLRVESGTTKKRHGKRGQAVMNFLHPDQIEKAEIEIRQAIQGEIDKGRNFLFGMAAAANGSDILFHEACSDLKINSRLYLALPKDQYVGEYVAAAGAKWVDRFNKLYQARSNDSKQPDRNHRIGEFDADNPVNILGDSTEMPRWLQTKFGYSAGKRNAAWMLQHALVQRSLYGADKTTITMIALWDRNEINATGNIAELIAAAEKDGVKVIHLDCSKWETDQAAAQEAAARPEAADGLSEAATATAQKAEQYFEQRSADEATSRRRSSNKQGTPPGRSPKGNGRSDPRRGQ